MSDLSLKQLSKYSGNKGPQIIVVMDGVGLGPDFEGNAVKRAYKPNLDWLFANCQWTSLQAHGTAVGLPSDGDMGNSEVGHNAIGAGRVFAQGAKLVNEAIESGKIFRGEAWGSLIKQVTSNSTTLHFIGLLSDGNVHSHQNHLFALIDQADKDGVKQVRVHPLLDGRDVDPISAHTYITSLETILSKYNAKADRDYRIASGGGRMSVTMDRYWANVPAVERGWNAHVHGEGRKFKSAMEAIETYRAEQPGLQDQNMFEFVVVDESANPIGKINDGDSVVFFNFRGDRAVPLSLAFEDKNFSFFDRKRVPQVLYTGMMQYDGDLLLPKNFLVNPPEIERTMSEYLSRNKISQFACSESFKFGHVTYFWNGNRSGKFDDKLEDFVEIKSDLAVLEERPWMKIAEITDATIAALRSGKYKQLRINFTNGDMVGHTGSLDGAILAVESVDLSLGRILKVIKELNGLALVTADHGNSDEMYEVDKKTKKAKLDSAGHLKACVSHTLNPVPFIIYDPSGNKAYKLKNLSKAGLGNIAATAINLLGYEAPSDYMESLVEF